MHSLSAGVRNRNLCAPHFALAITPVALTNSWQVRLRSAYKLHWKRLPVSGPLVLTTARIDAQLVRPRATETCVCRIFLAQSRLLHSAICGEFAYAARARP